MTEGRTRYEAEHRNEINAKARAYYQTHKAYHREYYQKNRERILEESSARYSRDAEKIRAAQKEYYAAHAEERRKYARERQEFIRKVEDR